jgi:hydroxymethylpyrimidine/phosphomethylpyrimidine kinase
MMRAALAIAGSDPVGGAGIQADLKTFAALGVYGTSAITAITVQNTLGVTAVAPVSADLVTAQIEAVAGDVQIYATKIGMLATAAIVEAVAAAIQELELPMVVVDPVMTSSSGERLLDGDGVGALIAELLPRARVVTPNIPEAEALSGYRIASPDDARRAAERIRNMGASAVIIKGGHSTGSDIVDLLYDGETLTEVRTARIHGRRTHGTGCAFASAVAANLALGHSLADSTRMAQTYVTGAIAHAVAVGHGASSLDHFWGRKRAT